jgi:hypothetical protein
MKLPNPKQLIAGAFVAAAMVAPAPALAQDDPQEAEQRRAEERAARRAERAQQAAQAEQERARAEEAAQQAREAAREAARAVPPVQPVPQVAPARVFPQAQGAPHVWQVRPAQVETKPQTYLGVSTRQLTPDVAAHIGEVPEGVGLIVSFVDAEGPAGKAGLQEHDVLVKIDDQWLINPQQFSVLVRMHKAGDEATLTVYRKGEEQEIGVELIEKELPVAQNFFGQMELTPLAVPGFGEGLEGLQGELAPMAVPGLWHGALELDAARREEIEQKVQEAMRQLEEQMARGQQNMPELREHMQALRESLRSRELDLERLRRDAAPGSELMQRGLTRGGRLLINNEEMSLSMLNEDDEITVKISDADGETVYEGPFPTDEQVEELPDAAKEIIEQARKYLPGAKEPQEAEEESLDPEASPAPDRARRQRVRA